MPRLITEVEAQIATAESANGLPVLTPSATAIRLRWRRVVSSVVVALEWMFEQFQTEIQNIIATQKPHTLRWYRNQALRFQFGDALLDDVLLYDNAGQTDESIANKRIVKQAAATEVGGLVVLRVAKEVGGVLAPLMPLELIAFKAYVAELKDAGIQLEVFSYAADKLKVVLDVYYDPSVLSGTGERLDGLDSAPIQKAIALYLRNLEFNGVFVRTKMVDAVQTVTGVFAIEATSINVARFDSMNYESVNVIHAPFSGYYVLEDLTVNYIPYYNE
jgi:hypothetical protein